MSLTLAEASKLSNDVLQKGVIELFVYNDPILDKLVFKDILGNGLTYNVETTMSGASFYDVNETIVESTSTVTPATAVTKILIGDADVDNFLQTTRSDQQDLMQEQIIAKVKALKKKFMETFWYGNVSASSKAFDGTHTLINSATYNTIAVGTNNTTPVLLSLSKIEEAVDMVKGGAPDFICMSKMLRRYINKFLNGVGGVTKTDVQGKSVQTLNDIPVVVSDYLSNAENCNQSLGSGYGFEPTTPTAASDGATSVFVLRVAPEAICGIQSGGTINVTKLGPLETKDAERVRIKWYPGLMCQSIITCSKVTGIDCDGTVAV